MVVRRKPARALTALQDRYISVVRELGGEEGWITAEAIRRAIGQDVHQSSVYKNLARIMRVRSDLVSSARRGYMIVVDLNR